MSLLADYQVLLDGKITPALTSDGAFHDFAVPLPSNFFQSRTHLPLLIFRLDTGLPAGLEFRIRTSRFAPTPPTAAVRTVFSAVYNSDVLHSVHETVHIDDLLGGATNTIRFERTGGSGTLDIATVVLWYKRNVTTTDLAVTP